MMKFLISLSLLLSFLWASSQDDVTYYDYLWNSCGPEDARFYSLTRKTDSGWLRTDFFMSNNSLQMHALFSDEECTKKNGTYFYFYSNKTLKSEGRALNNKYEGVCISYHYNGLMSDSAFYVNGRPVGIRMQWYSNGFTSDSMNFTDDKSGTHVQWHDNGVIAGAGFFEGEHKKGIWKYYHRNGQLAATETFMGGMMLSAEYWNEDGTAVSDPRIAEKEVEFKNNGEKGWHKYIQKNIYWPPGLKLTNGNKAVVVVSFVINEEGKVEDAYVSTPFHPEFDKIALNAVLKSPPWLPARSHNLNIKTNFRQSVSFVQEE